MDAQKIFERFGKTVKTTYCYHTKYFEHIEYFEKFDEKEIMCSVLHHASSTITAIPSPASSLT